MEDFYRCDPRAERLPWLESVNGLTLRAHLAGLIKVGTAVRSGTMRSRLWRPIRRSFELEFDLNRPKSRPLVRPRR